jgi:KUP system potassium uptake protein
MPRVRTDLTDMNLDGVMRVPGSAVFFSSGRQGCPTSFLHNLRHNKVMHQQVVFLTVEFTDTPRLADGDRIDLERLPEGVTRLVARFGYRESADITRVLKLARRRGLELDIEQTSFFTSKPVVVSVSRRGAFGWRRSLFGWLLQNSPTTANYFSLPPNRVVELGTQVAI